MTLKKNDLDVNLFLGLVLSGKMGELVKIRDELETSLGNGGVVFNTLSNEYLFIVKKSKLTVEQKVLFEKEKEKTPVE